MSGCSSGAVLCLHSGVDLTIGHIAKTWSSPAVASHPPLHDMSRRRTTAPALFPEKDCERTNSSSEVLLPGHRTGIGDLAIDRPDKSGELACDQRPVARAQAALRLPGDLTNSL